MFHRHRCYEETEEIWKFAEQYGKRKYISVKTAIIQPKNSFYLFN